MPKNILYVVPSTGIGGAETFLEHTAEFHHVEEFRPLYACFRNGPLVEKLRRRGHTVHIAPQAPRLSRPWKGVRTVRWLSQLIQREKIDLVHSTLAYGAIFGSLASARNKKPHLWFQHGPVSGWQDWLAGILPSDSILVNSKHTASKQKALGIKTEIKQLRLGVSMDSLALNINHRAVRAEILREFSNKEISFLSVMLCRPQPQKGISLWLKASAEMRNNGINAACLLIGGTEFSLDLQKIADNLKVPFLQKAALSSPWSIAGAADALVCASISPEGYGLTLVEANTYGVPAIAPKEGGPLDILEAEKTGLFYEPRSYLDLAKVMERLARDPELAEKIVTNGRAKAQIEFLAEHSISQLEKTYRTFLEDR